MRPSDAPERKRLYSKRYYRKHREAILAAAKRRKAPALRVDAKSPQVHLVAAAKRLLSETNRYANQNGINDLCVAAYVMSKAVLGEAG